jgi:uncharacterized protein YbjT (DUF2867 family)
MAVKGRVLVTGGGTLLGDAIASALLAEGAEVVLFVRPGTEDRLGVLANRVRWFPVDVWDAASMKGRARGCTTAIHTVGGMRANPREGLTYQWLNFISARNVANLCVSSGVGHMLLLSAARAPWTPGQYIAAKREAEAYIARVGLHATIIRAPLVYRRGARRHPFFALLSLLRHIPPFSLFGLNRIAPIPLDVLARGVARIALEPHMGERILYAADLRRRSTRGELRFGFPSESEADVMRQRAAAQGSISLIPPDENIPFGWTP